MNTTLKLYKRNTENIINIPSPSGYCQEVIAYIFEQAKGLGFDCSMTAKGNGIIHIPCRPDKKLHKKGVLLTAHVDTLGAMVRSIKPDGKIRMTSVGGFMMQSVEGEYCTIHMRNKKNCYRNYT